MFFKKYLITSLLLINLGATACDSTQETLNLELQDLEFYVNPLNCLPKYIYCYNNLKNTNPKYDCLSWSKCPHLTTLQALINLPYVQSQILDLAQNNAINKLLITYGKNNLDQFIQAYPDLIFRNLINDLIANLNGNDLKTLSNANARPTPPVDFAS